MYPRLLLRFIQYFSFLQQYLIILSVSIIFLILFHYWWCIFLLPLSTVAAYFAVQRLSREQQSPIAFTGHLYDFFIRKRTAKEINEVIQIEKLFPILSDSFLRSSRAMHLSRRIKSPFKRNAIRTFERSSPVTLLFGTIH